VGDKGKVIEFCLLAAPLPRRVLGLQISVHFRVGEVFCAPEPDIRS
jgi:hypothetical protein